MSSIIVGRFQLQDETENAVEQLVQTGHPRAAIATYYLNPAGQHDLYPIGGPKTTADSAPADENLVRKAGMRLAIANDDEEQESRAVATLRELGAFDLESSAGNIIDGDWKDFDPLTPPRYIDLGNPATTPVRGA